MNKPINGRAVARKTPPITNRIPTRQACKTVVFQLNWCWHEINSYIKSRWSPELYQGSLRICINCVHSCEDHSSFDDITWQQLSSLFLNVLLSAQGNVKESTQWSQTVRISVVCSTVHAFGGWWADHLTPQKPQLVTETNSHVTVGPRSLQAKEGFSHNKCTVEVKEVVCASDFRIHFRMKDRGPVCDSRPSWSRSCRSDQDATVVAYDYHIQLLQRAHAKRYNYTTFVSDSLA